MGDLIFLKDKREKKPKKKSISLIEATKKLTCKKIGITAAEHDSIIQKFLNHAKTLDW